MKNTSYHGNKPTRIAVLLNLPVEDTTKMNDDKHTNNQRVKCWCTDYDARFGTSPMAGAFRALVRNRFESKCPTTNSS